MLTSTSAWHPVSGAGQGLFFDLFEKLALLAGDFRAEIFGLEDLTQLEFGVGAGVGMGALFEPLEGFGFVLDLPDPEAGDELLGFGEGAVGDDALVADEFHAGALGAGLQTFAGE